MTNQEEIQSAIEWIEGLRDGWNDKDNVKYCNIAIKALEQEPILDKIRAEIIGKDKNVKAVRSDSYCFFTVEEVLEIINKYRAESKLDGNPVDIDKVVEHYERTLETLKDIDLEDKA